MSVQAGPSESGRQSGAHERHIRPLVTADLPDLLRLDRESYLPELRESEAAFLSKMALFRAGALGCFDASDLRGYVFALPWRSDSLVGVAQVLDALPDAPDVMYLHDLVVASSHRRHGIGSTLVAAVLRLAESLHLHRLVLVAVQGSEPFWARSGFVPTRTFDYVPGVQATMMAFDRTGRS